MTSAALSRELHEIEIVGPLGAPVVVVLGGISASRHVTASPANPSPGWWQPFVGDDRPIDTNRFRVLSIDYRIFGRNGRSLTTEDQALALAEALDAEGIGSVRAIVGASYGGMVALAFAAIAHHRVGHLVVIGAAHESAPLSTALRILQRCIVERGVRTGAAHDAVVLARGIAMTTYSTSEDFSDRFDSDTHDPRVTQQLVAEFLRSSGEIFARSCPADRFLALSLSLDLHHVSPEDIRVPTTLIAVEQDSLVPVRQMRDLAGRLGGPCRLVEISSKYGHDTFLRNPDLLEPHVRRALSSLTLHSS